MYKVTKNEATKQWGVKKQTLEGKIFIPKNASLCEHTERSLNALKEAASSDEFKNASTSIDSMDYGDRREYKFSSTITSTVYDSNDLYKAKTAFKGLEKKFEENMKSSGFRKANCSYFARKHC